MEYSSYTTLSSSELTSDALEGATIYDPEDEEVGTISHLHGSGDLAHAIVDVGTFLGMGGKSVSIPMSALRVMRDGDGTLLATTGWSNGQIKDLPEHRHV